MSDWETEGEAPEPAVERVADDEVPVWDDEYLDRVSDRLLATYDLEKDREAGGERFALYGEMRITNQKHLFHPALSYAEHSATEHLFARRTGSVTVADVEALVDLGHDLAEAWIDANEDHFSTDFTFVAVADAVPEDVRSFVSGFRERTLLKYGYYGHYEVNLVVVAPEREDLVASAEADVAEAFRLWDPEEESPGLLGRLFG